MKELVPLSGAAGKKEKIPPSTVAVPVILGVLYEGEEVQPCPLCGERLMWYHTPGNMEMLVCTSPRCLYPFDETSPYQTRSRDHGKLCIEGTTAPPEDEQNQKELQNYGAVSHQPPPLAIASCSSNYDTSTTD